MTVVIPGLDPLSNMLKRIEECERRIRRMMYQGTVSDLDHKKGLIRIDDGAGTEDEPHTTDWIPWCEHAGKIKTRTMPSKGQTVTVFSPSGDPVNAFAMIGWFNKANPMPKAENGEHVLVYGKQLRRTTSEDDKGQVTFEQKVIKDLGDEGKIGEPDQSGGGGSQDGEPPQAPPFDESTPVSQADESKKAVFTQKMENFNHNVDDKAIRDQTPAHIQDNIGGTETQITSDNLLLKGQSAISSQSPRIEDVGKSYLGLDNSGETGQPIVTKFLKDSKRVFATQDIPDPQGPPGLGDDPESGGGAIS